MKNTENNIVEFLFIEFKFAEFKSQRESKSFVFLKEFKLRYFLKIISLKHLKYTKDYRT